MRRRAWGGPPRSYVKRYEPLVESIRTACPRLFRINHIEEVAGVGPTAAHQLAARLVRNGLLRRVGPGLFTRADVPDSAFTLSELLDFGMGRYEADHLAFETALRIHGHGPPVEGGEVILRTEGVTRPLRLGAHFTVIRVNAGMRRTQGVVEVQTPRLGVVPVSDPLHTALDGLDHPNKCGGFLNVVRFVATRHASWTDAALHDATRHMPGVPLLRLGYLLERLGREVPRWLLPKARVEPFYAPLDRSGPGSRALDRRWHLRLNVEEGALREALAGGAPSRSG